MTNQIFGNPPPIPPPVKEGHGCFFWGCMTSLIALALLGIGAYLGVMKLASMARQYTSDQPMKIESVVLPPAQMMALNVRIAAFQQAMKEDRPARLVLTADEINAKLSSQNDFAALAIKARVEIEGDKITAIMSMPCPIEKFGLKGRYINGKATIQTGLQMGRLLLYVDAFEVGGKPLPESFMSVFRTKNLAENAMKNPDTAATLAKLKTLSVQNGTVIVEK